MKIIDQIKRIFVKPKKKDITVNEYAIITWREDTAEFNLKGDRHKIIIVNRYGNREICSYSMAELNLLKNNDVPIYDSTKGLDRPLSMYSPMDLVEMKTGMLETSKSGIFMKGG